MVGFVWKSFPFHEVHFIDPKYYHRSSLSSCVIFYLGEGLDEEEEEENDADEVVDCREEAADSALVYLAWLNALLWYISLFLRNIDDNINLEVET